MRPEAEGCQVPALNDLPCLLEVDLKAHVRQQIARSPMHLNVEVDSIGKCVRACPVLKNNCEPVTLLRSLCVRADPFAKVISELLDLCMGSAVCGSSLLCERKVRVWHARGDHDAQRLRDPIYSLLGHRRFAIVRRPWARKHTVVPRSTQHALICYTRVPVRRVGRGANDLPDEGRHQ